MLKRSKFLNLGFRAGVIRNFSGGNGSIFNVDHPLVKRCKIEPGEQRKVGSPRIGNPEDYDLLSEYIKSINIKNKDKSKFKNVQYYHMYMIENEGKLVHQNIMYHYTKIVGGYITSVAGFGLLYNHYFSDHILKTFISVGVYVCVSVYPLCFTLDKSPIRYLEQRLMMRSHLGLKKMMNDRTTVGSKDIKKK